MQSVDFLRQTKRRRKQCKLSCHFPPNKSSRCQRALHRKMSHGLASTLSRVYTGFWADEPLASVRRPAVSVCSGLANFHNHVHVLIHYFLGVYSLSAPMTGTGGTQANKRQSQSSQNVQVREKQKLEILYYVKGLHSYHVLRAHHNKPDFGPRGSCTFFHSVLREVLLTRFFR